MLSRHARKQAGKKTGARRSAVKRKPAWDSTVRDLTVHKLSKEEQELRRTRIQSKNTERASRELNEIAKDARQLASPGSHRSSVTGSGNAQEKELHSVLVESDRAMAVVKDLFGDDPKRYTGKPNITVAPHVTMDKSALQRTLLESQRDGPDPSALNSPGGIRDDSVLGLAPPKPALNELPSPSSDFSINESGLEDSSLLSTDQHSSAVPPSSTYRPVLDIHRFQKLVEQKQEEDGGERREEETAQTASTGAQHNTERASGGSGVLETGQVSSIPHCGSQRANETIESQMTSNAVSTQAGMQGRLIVGESKTASDHSDISSQTTLLSQHDHAQGNLATPLTHKPHPLQIVHKMPLKRGQQPHLPQHTSALASQDTSSGGGVISRNQRVRKLSPGMAGHAGTVPPSKGIHDDLSVLQQLVQNLERELQDYEQTSGYSFPVQKPPTTQTGVFSSLTASLLGSVTKLTHYLKQSEVQLKGEVAVRNQLLHAMAEQQNLMDALTADVVKLQEENTSLKSGFELLKEHTTQQTKSLEEGMLELRTKLSSLEQTKLTVPTISSQPVSTAAQKPSPRPEVVPAAESLPLPTCNTSVTLSAAPTVTFTPSSSSIPLIPPAPASFLLQTDNIASPQLPLPLSKIGSYTSYYSSSPLLTTMPVIAGAQGSVPRASAGVGVSSVGVAAPNSVIYAQRSPLSYPAFGTLPLSSLHSTSPSAPFVTPVAHNHQSVPTPNAKISTRESTRLHPLYHASSETTLPAFHSPFSALATPVSGPTVGLPPPVLSPSELGVSPPPLSIALQVPSLPFRPPVPPSLTSSLPYSWNAPFQSTTNAANAGIPTLTPFALSVSSASVPIAAISSTPLSSSNMSVSTNQSLQPEIPALVPPNLSLTAMSPSGSETTLCEGSPSSDSSVDIEASLARMSSLARSVLEELAQDRGQLLKAPVPSQTNQNPNKPFNPSSGYMHAHASHPPLRTASIMTSLSASGATQPSHSTVESEEHKGPSLGFEKDSFPKHVPGSTAMFPTSIN